MTTGPQADRAGGAVGWAALAAFGGWAGWLALSAEGFLEADEVAHWLYARHGLENPGNFLHVWARPLATLLLAPVAQLGFGAARLLSAGSAILAAACAFLAARSLGWRAAACAVPLTFVQPLLFQQTFGIWTEVTFSALLGAWMLAVAARRPRTAAAVAAVLPLARPEGFVVAAGVAIAALCGGLRDGQGRPVRAAALAVLPLGVLAWAAAGFFASGDPLWLPHHWPPNWAPDAAYGRGPWTWVTDVLPDVVPRSALPLVALGCVAPGMRRAWLVPVVGVLVLGVHAALWRFGAFGSAGYARYFVTLAPAFALLATGGVEILARVVRVIPGWTWAVAVSAVAVFLLLAHPTATHPPPSPPDARLFEALGRWILGRDPDPVLHAAHPFAYLALNFVPPERFDDFGLVSSATLAAARPGTWVLVEDRFYAASRGGPGAAGNPDGHALAALGYVRVLVPDLGVGLAVVDRRHDRALGGMSWALFRKGGG